MSREPPQLVLEESAAARVWNWVLVRQGLADSQRLSTVLDVADAALGLHAARLPSPYAIVAARSSDPAVPASLFTAPVRASLLTVRCMRKTPPRTALAPRLRRARRNTPVPRPRRAPRRLQRRVPSRLHR